MNTFMTTDINKRYLSSYILPVCKQIDQFPIIARKSNCDVIQLSISNLIIKSHERISLLDYLEL
jgi:hypothetical protein